MMLCSTIRQSNLTMGFPQQSDSLQLKLSSFSTRGNRVAVVTPEHVAGDDDERRRRRLDEHG
jgi:hypothetical protein